MINVAVKTCKKDCTLDNKEKFMSEAGRCPWGDTSIGAGKKPGHYADGEEGRVEGKEDSSTLITRPCPRD